MARHLVIRSAGRFNGADPAGNGNATGVVVDPHKKPFSPRDRGIGGAAFGAACYGAGLLFTGVDEPR